MNTRLLSTLLVAFALGSPLHSAERAALVIGNGAYQKVPKLKNPVPDARAMGNTLKGLGFKVETIEDGTTNALMAAADKFAAGIKGAEVALIYYAGHGVQAAGENYLLGVDSDPTVESQLAYKAMPLGRMLSNLEGGGSALNILVLDCCRDNPLRAAGRSVGTKGGLAPAVAPRGTFIAYAADANQQALDLPDAANGLYTGTLIKHLKTPGLRLEDIFIRTREEVVTVALQHQHTQEPAEYSKVSGAFYFQPVKEPPVNIAKTSADANMKEAELQRRIEAEVRKRMQTNLPPPSPSSKLPSPTSSPRGFTNSLGMEFVPVPNTKVMFCIHETRNADYAVYAADSSGVDSTWKSKANSDKDQHPVLEVNWEDANGFCKWLSKKEGKIYRLPTDHEWSVAVGIGDQEDASASPESKSGRIVAVYPWGGDFPPGPKDGNYSFHLHSDKFDDTAPVKQFAPNRLGIYDMGGNVAEWCADLYSPTSTSRVARGTGWGNGSRTGTLSCFRASQIPTRRDGLVGFRVVLETEASIQSASALSRPSTLTSSSASKQNKMPLSGGETDSAPHPTASGGSVKLFVNSLGMKFVVVPNTNVMFCIHETRNADYAACASANNGVDVKWKSQATSGKDQHPVVKVSWEDAVAFCKWLSAKEGRTYRLPTDHEWSCAVGIGGQESVSLKPEQKNGAIHEVFPWGSAFLPPPSTAGNYSGEERVGVDKPSQWWKPIKGFRDGFVSTAPVMSFTPNSMGIYDLGGNVDEWCEDHFDPSTVDTNDPTITEGRVYRGGSWNDSYQGRLLSSTRDGMEPDSFSTSVGFRCVLENP